MISAVLQRQKNGERFSNLFGAVSNKQELLGRVHAVNTVNLGHLDNEQVSHSPRG